MIDLHCHILPGLDDGAPDPEASVALARQAAAEGVETIAATPHVRGDYPLVIGELPERRAAVNLLLAEAGIAVSVVAGGELALSEAPDLTDDELATIRLGEGNYLLVEAPYQSGTELLERG